MKMKNVALYDILYLWLSCWLPWLVDRELPRNFRVDPVEDKLATPVL